MYQKCIVTCQFSTGLAEINQTNYIVVGWNIRVEIWVSKDEERRWLLILPLKKETFKQ